MSNTNTNCEIERNNYMDIKDYFYQFNYIPIPRTAIEAEILLAARVTQVRFLERLSGKTPLKKSSSGKKIGAESAVPILVHLCIVLMVHKYRQSAKENCLLKRNTAPEVFPLTAILAGSGKTRPFEKRHAGCEEREKINRRRIFDTLRINFFEATKQTACIFSKGGGNMTRKVSTTNIPGARGNAYPKAELDYSLDYEYDPAYAHRLIHAGNRYYRYDANGNITAEKDGPFTEDDEFIFTYNYDPDTDVYGTDYGFGLDAPKETEETHPENLFAYRRNYTWNEKNLLTKSSDRTYTVHYRYGEDGQRALKYTEEGRSETLYFNNFYTIHIPVQDKNNPQGLRVHKHIFVGNSRLVTAMTHTDNNGDNAEQREKRYYYHSDHLGSAQFVTDWRGRQYEHIEYTPYGELWIEEVAAGLDKLPFRFTGKELDEETGLYYYGARYLDPKYSRWLSGDPALNDYIPKAPVDDKAKKHNENLPGMGGVFNVVNLHLYHYAGNNPVKYADPDGRETDTSLNNLKKVAKEIRATGSIDGKNIYLSPTNLRRDGCFARASIIAEGLRAKGYKVDYAFANNPKIPGGKEDQRFNYHIAASVEVDGKTYVVDPLYNLEGPLSGLSEFKEWTSFRDAKDGEKDSQKSRIISGYDADGGVKENPYIQYFYDKYNKNKKLSVPEYAEKLLENFKKTDALDYDGGELK